MLCSGMILAFNVIPNRMASRVARDITEKIRMDLYEKTSSLSCSQVDAVTIPSLISRITTDTYHVHRMLNMIQRLGVRAPLLLTGGLIVTMVMEPRLGAVLFAMLPLMVFAIVYFSKKGIPLYTASQQKGDKMVRIVRENIVGIRIIKALSKVDYEKEHFESANLELSRQEKKAGVTMAALNPMVNLFLNSGLVCVILLGAYLVHIGVTQIGQIIAFQSYFTIILNAVIAMSRMFVLASKGIASADRIQEILDLPDELTVEQKTEGAIKAEEDAFIAFDHVSFSYLGQKDNLSDISFKLKKGETLGIIGSTGSGKTTVIHLLMRLYDVTKGQIRIQGVDVKEIPKETLHTMFGVTFQSDVVFAQTIRENIAFGRTLTQEEIQLAARQAQAMDFISGREKGFEEDLSIRGHNLSGGQKQRLLIARALAGNPQILVLDDASSALDYKTDAALRAAIRDGLKDTTSIIIAQRVSSIMQADHILVLEQGKMIGYGTHEELMKNCETYREIAGSQLGDGKLHKDRKEGDSVCGQQEIAE